MKTIYRQELPDCDICGATALDTVIDAPFRGSSWAHQCATCFKRNRSKPSELVGTKIVRGKHPRADDQTEKPAPFTVGAALDEKRRRQKERAYLATLTHEDLERMLFDGDCECADGCFVEPDGTCPHGYTSPLRLLGVV